MKKLSLLLSAVIVSVAVALTYYYFQHLVHETIHFLWQDLLNSDTYRLLVVPLCIVLGLIFFGLQHYLDPKSEKHEDHGLGQAPTPTIVNFFKVLLIGFSSLVAGASLGPEAILVPACIIIGTFIGTKIYKHDKQSINLLAVAAFVGLLAAFFHAFLAGILGLLLVGKEFKMKLNLWVVIIGVVASGVVVIVLDQLKASPYAKLPPSNWDVSWQSLLVMIALIAGGYVITYLLKASHDTFKKLHTQVAGKSWWVHGLVGSAGLAVLYLLGGTLVEFTGNQSVVPLLQQSAGLGVLGLLWIILIKILAIGWSKALGYRGGLIFPSIFVASAMVATVQTWRPGMSFMPGLLAAMAGVLAANAKAKVLL